MPTSRYRRATPPTPTRRMTCWPTRSSRRGKPYNALLKEKITAPLRHGRHHADAEPRVLAPDGGGGRPERCRDTTAAAGSGVYSTPRDMQRWMQQFLSSSASGSRKATAASEQNHVLPASRSGVAEARTCRGADALVAGCMAPKDGLRASFRRPAAAAGSLPTWR
ncbi:serine hydrolase [Serratia marcescens]|uniref:Serine hydrolase n=1 Tax=Serratia marcescens TaxID=615 RepID=A0A939SV28_SERMA|nr:serine hydrolase [Serratia marcescens]